MFENISEQYGQFIIMGIVFLIGALVYAGYLYYNKKQDMKNVNNNLQNINTLDKDNMPPQQPPQQPPPQQSPDFVPSDTFKGEKKGYVFKKGEKGTGYYKEKSKII